MRRMIAAVALVATLAGACSSGGSGLTGSASGNAWETPPTEQGLIDATRTSIDSVFRSDWDLSYQFFTAECRDRYGKGDFIAEVASSLAFAAGFMGLELDDLKRLETGRVEVVDFTPQRAVVASEMMLDGEVFFAMDLADTTEMIYEDGGWRSVECEDGTLSDGDNSIPADGNNSIPDAAVEVDYASVEIFVQQIEDDETGATWYRLDYDSGTEPTYTYLKTTDGAFPLAITVGDCGIAEATYPNEQAGWTEFCY